MGGLEKLKVGVLTSGEGTNLQAILEACAAEKIGARVCVVISNVANAKALERALRFHVPTFVLTQEEEIIRVLRQHGVGLICLAGFMRILSKEFVRQFPNQILNIHPALLPSFPGLNAQRQAWEYGAKVTGATVHFVDERVDHGPILIQAVVPLSQDDTVGSLKQKILQEEHRIYPAAIGLIADGRVKVEERRTFISDL